MIQQKFVTIQNTRNFYFDIEKLPSDMWIVQSFSSLNDDILANTEFLIEAVTSVKLDKEVLIDSVATLNFFGFNENIYHRGVISHIEFQGKRQQYYCYQFTMKSLLNSCCFFSENRVFNHIKIPALVKKILLDYHQPWMRLKFQLSNNYFSHEIIVQYDETDWDFIARLLRSENIGFVWQHYSDYSDLVFFDKLQQLPNLSGNSQIPYVTLSNQTREVESIWNFRAQNEWLKSADKIIWQDSLFFAESDCMGFAPGLRFILEDHPQNEYNRAYRILSVKHFGQQSTGIVSLSMQEQTGYHNEIVCIPDDVSYYPELPLLAKHYEFFTANIVGLQNDVPLLDSAGRYQAKFDFDQNKQDGMYYPLPLMQPYNSNGAGMHFPLRHETEVLITFLNGDLNHPIIIGALPNADSPSSVHQGTFYQHNMITQLGNQLRLIDNPKDLQLLLSTPENLNYFQLQAKQAEAAGAHKIELASEQGSASLSAQKKMTRKSADNHTQVATGNHVTTIDGNAVIASKQRAIEYNTGQAFQQQSQENIILQTQLIAQTHIQEADKPQLVGSSHQQERIINDADNSVATLEKMFPAVSIDLKKLPLINGIIQFGTQLYTYSASIFLSAILQKIGSYSSAVLSEDSYKIEAKNKLSEFFSDMSFHIKNHEQVSLGSKVTGEFLSTECSLIRTRQYVSIHFSASPEPFKKDFQGWNIEGSLAFTFDLNPIDKPPANIAVEQHANWLVENWCSIKQAVLAASIIIVGQKLATIFADIVLSSIVLIAG